MAKSVDFITVADLGPDAARVNGQLLASLENRLRDFAPSPARRITSSAKLAAMMAGKAAIIKDIMGRALVADMKAREATGNANRPDRSV